MSDFQFPLRAENRRYISGFESSAGYLILTRNDAVLCTDFRYTEQASQQAPGWRVDRIGGKPDWLADLVNELKIKLLGFEADDISFNMHQALLSKINQTNHVCHLF